MPLPQNKQTFRSSRRRQLLWLIFLIACWALLGLVVLNRQAVLDWWRLRNYTPPPAIERLATQTSMTDYTRKVFYVNHPELSEKQKFSHVCPNNGGEATIVLGCYRSDQNGIFLLNVIDERLSGVEQVTAAHETLHAAYDRLSAAERQRVNKLLLNFYKSGLHDSRVRATINSYRRSEPNDLVNEMHSIFGTEVKSLPASLEHYYKRYFNNRQRIVAFAARYQAEFTLRQQAVLRDDAQLANLKAQIDTRQASLQAMQAAISAHETRLSDLRQSGNVAAYNAGVTSFNNLVRTYNADVQTLRQLIAQYNQLVVERNAIAFEATQLTKELSPEPINQ